MRSLQKAETGLAKAALLGYMTVGVSAVMCPGSPSRSVAAGFLVQAALCSAARALLRGLPGRRGWRSRCEAITNSAAFDTTT